MTVIYEKSFKEDGRLKLPVEEVEDWPETFIPPLEHLYKSIRFSHHWPNSKKCIRCERTECANCFNYCPYCGGDFEE